MFNGLKQIAHLDVQPDFLTLCRHDLPERSQSIQCHEALLYWLKDAIKLRGKASQTCLLFSGEKKEVREIAR